MNQIDISAMMQQVAKNANELAKLPILDEKQRNYLYNMAAQKCQAGDYINAVPLFQFLVLFDRTDVNSIKGLAGALHGAARYSDAINCYHMTYLQDSMNHVDSLFYMADCNIKLNKLDEAKKEHSRFFKLCK